MVRIIVSVYDRAAQCYGQPFYVNAVGQATRSFTDEVNRADKDNPLFQHPEDFDLYQIGVYNDNDGSVVPNVKEWRDSALVPDVPVLIVRGKDVARRMDGDGNPAQLRVVQ